MMRGEIFATVGRGDFATKPRPALIVQTDLHNEVHPSITVCPITTTTTEERLYRIPIARNDANGLKYDSEIEIDKMQAIWRARLGQHIGTVSPRIMVEVDIALRRWLDL